MTRWWLVLGITVRLSAAAPGIDDALRFSVPSAPRISPNGTQVAYQLSRTNWEDNSFEGDIWLARTQQPFGPLPLAGMGWNGDAQWSPDGKYVAFISDRSGRRQIFVASAASRISYRVTSVEQGVNEFHWAPDSQSIAFTVDEDGDRNSDFEVVNTSRTSSRLWRTGIAPGSKPAELAPRAKYWAGGFAWSPNGSRIAFQSDGIYTLEVKTGEIRRIAANAGPYRNPVWSPDGEIVAFETAGGDPGYYYSNWNIAQVSANGGTVEVLSGDFDENADLVAWTPAGIYFGALQRTSSSLFLLDPATKAIRQVTPHDDELASQFSVAPDGSHYAWLASSPDALAEVVVDGKRQVTRTSEQLAGFTPARRQVVRWVSPDGVELEGILLTPPDFDPSKKYPLLVSIHGGPVAVDQPALRADRTYPLEQFVARGALVFRPNYRGSAGYGSRLRAMAVRTLGTGDAADVLSGIDSLVARGFVDSERVGAMGWSEGGYVAAFLGTSTDRFRAVSVGAGVSDWLTYYVNTDITPFTRQYLKATPWEDPEIYRKASPISYVNQAKTPVLIQHGDQDRRVPIPNAYELRQALEDHNVPVKMIVYRGFGHSIDRPRQQRTVMQHNLDWFQEWVLNPEAKAKPPVSFSRAATSGEPSGGLQ